MAKLDTFRCDECGIQKQETNHWWLIQPCGDGTLALSPWKEHQTSLPNVAHLCGQSCVHAALDRWMTNGSLSK